MAGELPEATVALERAVAAARDAGMWYTLVQALSALSQAESGRRRFPRAEGAIADALSCARRNRLIGLMPALLGTGAMLAYRTGDWVLARSRLEESLAAARRPGDLHVELATLNNLGTLAYNEGRSGEAMELQDDALRLARRIGDDRTALLIACNLAEAVLVGTRDTNRALSLATWALGEALAAGVRIAAVHAVESAAFALVERGEGGDAERAAALLGAAAAEREALERRVPGHSPPVDVRGRSRRSGRRPNRQGRSSRDATEARSTPGHGR